MTDIERINTELKNSSPNTPLAEEFVIDNSEFLCGVVADMSTKKIVDYLAIFTRIDQRFQRYWPMNNVLIGEGGVITVEKVINSQPPDWPKDPNFNVENIKNLRSKAVNAVGQAVRRVIIDRMAAGNEPEQAETGIPIKTSSRAQILCEVFLTPEDWKNRDKVDECCRKMEENNIPYPRKRGGTIHGSDLEKWTDLIGKKSTHVEYKRLFGYLRNSSLFREWRTVRKSMQTPIMR